MQRTNGPRAREGPMRVRVHIRGTLNQASGLCRERERTEHTESSRPNAPGISRGRRKCTRRSSFFARGSLCLALIFALFLLLKASTRPTPCERRKRTEDAFIIRFRLARSSLRASRMANDDDLYTGSNDDDRWK